MLWGKMVAPRDVAVTVHRIDAVEERNAEAVCPAPPRQESATMSAHTDGVLVDGLPFAAAQDRSDGVVGDLGRRDAARSSTCVIWPIFSA